ncbi:MAG: hypothetical protein JKP96_11480 [Oceanicaulis sp.]|jgi:hypothetical protein|nr:hypothetical protein [Oceanicaulis sp.]
MDTQSKPVTLIATLGVILAAALLMRWVLSRGKTFVEGLIGLVSGCAGALLLGAIAHLIGDPPVLVQAVLPNSEAWVGACVAFGAMAGDRIAMGIMKEADRFSKDPRSWLGSWLPRLSNSKSDSKDDQS